MLTIRTTRQRLNKVLSDFPKKMNTTINNVAIVGGTHGNELTGAYLLERWKQRPAEVTRPTFATHLFLANPKAFEQNRRFIDEDLNRCFGNDALLSVEPLSYEAKRAVVLNQEIGPKGASKHDFVIDLHTSTSNCGVMIILFDDNSFNLRVAAYITAKMPEARIFHIPPTAGDQPYLNSICPRGLAVEIGPIPQGLLRDDVFSLTHRVVAHALDYAHHENVGTVIRLPEQVEVFRLQEFVKFPTSGLCIDAMIHESLQGRDYEPLNPGDPMFRRLDGEVVTFEGPATVYPVFINEAAYYYKCIAMSLTVKQNVRIPLSNVSNVA